MAISAERVRIWLPGAPEPVPYTSDSRGSLPPYLPTKGDTVVWDGQRYVVCEIQYIFSKGRLVLILVHVADMTDPGPGPGPGRSATDLATRRKSA